MLGIWGHASRTRPDLLLISAASVAGWLPRWLPVNVWVLHLSQTQTKCIVIRDYTPYINTKMFFYVFQSFSEFFRKGIKWVKSQNRHNSKSSICKYMTYCMIVEILTCIYLSKMFIIASAMWSLSFNSDLQPSTYIHDIRTGSGVSKDSPWSSRSHGKYKERKWVKEEEQHRYVSDHWTARDLSGI